MSDSLRAHGLQHTRLPCPWLFPGVCSNPYPLSLWHCLTISSSATAFSFCLQSFPALRYFPMSWLSTSGGQSVGASPSVLSMNIQGWFPLGLIGLTSFLSKGFSRLFSSTTIWKHRFFTTQLLYGPTLTSIHDCWKNHSFDYTELCWQSIASRL